MSVLKRVQQWRQYLAILAGDCLVVVMFMMLSVQSPAAAVSSAPVNKRFVAVVIPALSGEPQRLDIPNLQLSLPVVRGTFDPDTESWTDGGTQVVFAEGSVPPNDSNGTTLLYGHAQSNIFVDLPKLQPGNVISVSTDNGYIFNYRFVYMREVVPTDISVFTELGAPTLVLQTCSGPWDSYRALYYFDLQDVTK